MTNIAASVGYLLTIVPETSGSDRREMVARIIHAHLRPNPLSAGDWDSGAVLGAGNAWRRKVYATVDALLAAPLAEVEV